MTLRELAPEMDDPYQRLLAETADTLPRQLATSGYETLTTGKVTHTVVPELWDTVEPFPEVGDLLDSGSESSRTTGFDFGLLDPSEPHADQVAADWTAARLHDQRVTPFALMVGFFQPHTPWRLPAWAFDEYPIESVVVPSVPADDHDDLPPAAVELAAPRSGPMQVTRDEVIERSGRATEIVQAYLAAITHTDHMVGQVLDALSNSPHADDTSVIIWSDNGFHLGEKLHWGKGTLWERSARVPLIIRDPDLAPGRFDAPVGLIDLAPTVLDLAGVDPPESWDGSSLIGLSEDDAVDRPVRTSWGGHRSVRSEHWRYTRYEDGGEELYDLAADPDEIDNLAGIGAHAATLERLRPLA